MQVSMHLRHVTPSDVRVVPRSHALWLGEITWWDPPEQVRAVLAEIDRRLPAPSREQRDALLARWQDRQPADGEVVDSLRLVTSAHFVPGPRSERPRHRVLRRIADCRTLATGAGS